LKELGEYSNVFREVLYLELTQNKDLRIYHVGTPPRKKNLGKRRKLGMICLLIMYGACDLGPLQRNKSTKKLKSSRA
jgi:hypothetical protein